MFTSHYLWAFLFIVFSIGEVALAKSMTFFGTRPDLILLLTAFAGLNSGLLHGAIIGFAGGLANEIFSKTPLGPGTFSLTLIGFLAGLFGRRVFYQNVFIQVIIIFIATFLKMALTNGLLIFIHYAPASPKVIISQAFYNALLTPLIFFLLIEIFRDRR